MKKSIKITSILISIAIVTIISVIFLKSYILLGIVAVIYVPTIRNILTLLSEAMLIFSATYIIYRYILSIIESIKNKKKLKPVLMIIFAILILGILIVLKIVSATFFANIMLPLIYIIGVIVIPLIIIGMIILGNSKTPKKITFTIIAIILTIGIYILNYNYLYIGSLAVTQNIDDFIKINKNTSEYNLIYLQNYKQKMDKEGYIDKFDLENI